MNKLIFKDKDVREKVLAAVDKICQPVIDTIGPLGKNVLYESDKGTFELTNDGKTIVRHIDLEDPVENAISEMIKDGAIRTDRIAGDGTSTTILYTQVLTKLSQDLSSRGMTFRSINELYTKVLGKIVTRLDIAKKVVKDKKTKLEIATISANNDKEIAEKVVEAVDVAGLDGMIYLELNQDEKTTLEKQVGYRIAPGMVYQNLYTDVGRPFVSYSNIPILILDKQLYYAEEAEHILKVAMDAGFKNLLIVAKGFSGDAPNTFIANHVHNTLNIAIVQLADDTALEDLAVYLGGTVVSETAGRRTESISKEDFILADKVSLDPQKVLLTNLKSSSKLKARVEHIKEELGKDKDNKKFQNRLASLTNGIVTIKIGGATEKEAREKGFRFEDSVNATRAAMRDGYLVGGGLSMYHSYDPSDYDTEEEIEVAKALTEASITRIARNAQIRLDWSKVKGNIGLNALTGNYEDLLKAGVVEPYKVTEMAMKNAASVAGMLSSIGTYILNDNLKENKETK